VDVNFAQVQTVAQAQGAAHAGVDVIVAQGTEAGGHTGSIGTFALVPAVVDVVGSVPVVAAGGIADGRGLAAALMLGAAGAWLGTRFVASQEWGGQPWEQAAVVAATADDTVRTSVYDQIRAAAFPEGLADRVLRNAFVDRWHGRDDELRAEQDALRQQLAEAAQRNDTRVVDISAGVASGMIYGVEPAGAIVRRIVREAEQLLRDRATTLIRDAG
jgi:nitronate monooxygenase